MSLTAVVDACPNSAAFFGFMGVTAAVVFCNLGSAYGTAKSGVGLASMGVIHADRVMRNIIPVIMAGILGIYGLIVGAILVGRITPPDSSGNKYSSFDGYAHLAAGITCGLASLASGLAIGVSGDAGVRAAGQQPKLFVALMLMMIFSEALGLFGFIVALMLSLKTSGDIC